MNRLSAANFRITTKTAETQKLLSNDLSNVDKKNCICGFTIQSDTATVIMVNVLKNFTFFA